MSGIFLDGPGSGRSDSKVRWRCESSWFMGADVVSRRCDWNDDFGTGDRDEQIQANHWKYILGKKEMNSHSWEFCGEYSGDFKLCTNCFEVCRSNELPPMSENDGYRHQEKPQGLPKSDLVTERPISPLLAYMQMPRLRWGGSYGIAELVIGVFIGVPCLPVFAADPFTPYSSSSPPLTES